MPIVVNLDIMMARRKISLGELAEPAVAGQAPHALPVQPGRDLPAPIEKPGFLGQGLPALRPVQLDSRLTWIRFNHALREPNRERCGVHFFIDDYLFQRAWHDPSRYALFLRSISY